MNDTNLLTVMIGHLQKVGLQHSREFSRWVEVFVASAHADIPPWRPQVPGMGQEGMKKKMEWQKWNQFYDPQTDKLIYGEFVWESGTLQKMYCDSTPNG